MAKTAKLNASKPQRQEPLEKQLWKAADKMRKNIDAAEYKHIVLGLIFLKYPSDAFEELHKKLLKGEGEYAGSDPGDPDEYRAETVIFFVPPAARGVTSSPGQSCQRSERTSKAPWAPSKRTIQVCEMSYNKCMPRILPTTVSQSPKFKSDDKTEYFYYHFHSCRTPAGRHALVDLDE